MVLAAEPGAPLTPAQAAEAKNAAMAAEAKQDIRKASCLHEQVIGLLLTWIVFIIAAVIGTVIFISIIMVCDPVADPYTPPIIWLTRDALLTPDRHCILLRRAI